VKTNLRKQFQSWRQRRTDARLARWGRTRAKGKRRLVIRTTLFWIGIMVPVNMLKDYLSEHRLRVSTVIVFAVAGLFFGFVSWWMMEGEYTAAQIDARRKVLRK
jgi:hypothetical protein